MRAPIPLVTSLVLLAGCVSLAPRPDPTRYYVLEAKASPANNPDRPAVPALGVGPVRLPAYLDRPEIVTRAGPTRLEVASADRWAAPLDALFTRVLAEELRAAVPAREVREWPWPPVASPEWSVSVDVLRFEGEPDGSAVLEARWTLRRGGAVADRGLTTARERGAGSDAAATVAALSRTLGALARDVAAAVATNRDEAPQDGSGATAPTREAPPAPSPPAPRSRRGATGGRSRLRPPVGGKLTPPTRARARSPGRRRCTS